LLRSAYLADRSFGWAHIVILAIDAAGTVLDTTWGTVVRTDVRKSLLNNSMNVMAKKSGGCPGWQMVRRIRTFESVCTISQAWASRWKSSPDRYLDFDVIRPLCRPHWVMALHADRTIIDKTKDTLTEPLDAPPLSGLEEAPHAKALGLPHCLLLHHVNSHKTIHRTRHVSCDHPVTAICCVVRTAMCYVCTANAVARKLLKLIDLHMPGHHADRRRY